MNSESNNNIDDISTENFSESDWENLSLLSAYQRESKLLNPDYIHLKTRLQVEKSVSTLIGRDGQWTGNGLIPVPSHVGSLRAQRIIQLDQECQNKSRECSIYMLSDADNACENILRKHGEEILCSLKTVAFLGAPQSGEDICGTGRLFLTKRKLNGRDIFHIFYYSYGEAASFLANEMTEVVHHQWLELFEHWVLINIKTKYGFQSTNNYKVRRDVNAQFLMVSLDEIISVLHRVSDYTEMTNMISHERLKESEMPFGNGNDCNCKESLTKCSEGCDSIFCHCCPSLFLIDQSWRWGLKEKVENDLKSLVCREENKRFRDQNVNVYDPYQRINTPMSSLNQEKISSRRFHTVNLTMMDSMVQGTKFRSVIVLSPDEPCSSAVDLVCLISKLVEEVREQKLSAMAVQVAQPVDIEAGSTSSHSYPSELLYKEFLLRMRQRYGDSTGGMFSFNFLWENGVADFSFSGDGVVQSPLVVYCSLFAWLLGFITLMMIIGWMNGSNRSKGYWGGLDWHGNAITYHPVFMFTGMIMCVFSAILSAKALPFKRETARVLHIVINSLAVLFTFLGMLAVILASDYKSYNSYGVYLPNVYNLHSFLGLAAMGLFSVNSSLGVLKVLSSKAKAAFELQAILKPNHAFLGIFTFFAAILAAETGVFQTVSATGVCGYFLNSPDLNPSAHYNDLPSGCKLGNGVGIMILLMAFFAAYALFHSKSFSQY